MKKNLQQQFEGIKIEYLDGDITVWSGMIPDWRPVKAGDIFGDEPLLKVGENSKISFHFYEGGQHLSAELKTPMTIRLDKKVLRKVSQNEVYLERMPTSIKSEQEGTLSLTLNEAFARSKMLLRNFADLTSELTDKVAQFDFVQVKRKPKNLLEILSPLRNAVIHPVVLPSQVKIEWKYDPRKDKNTAYDIFIWNTSIRPTVPVATVKGNHYFATLSNWEGYYFEVISSTGLRSGTKTFYFKRKNLDTRENQKELQIYDFLSINSPNNIQLLLKKGQKKKYPFRFSWTPNKKIKERHFYKIYFEKKSTSKKNPGAIKYKTESARITENDYVYNLEYGAYEWWLELTIKNTNGTVDSYNSNRHFISLAPPPNMKFGNLFSDAIKGLRFQTENHSTIYYE